MAAACEIQRWHLGFLCRKGCVNHSHPLSEISWWSSIPSRTSYTWTGVLGVFAFPLLPSPKSLITALDLLVLLNPWRSCGGILMWRGWAPQAADKSNATIRGDPKISPRPPQSWNSVPCWEQGLRLVCCAWALSRGIQITFPSFPPHRLFG